MAKSNESKKELNLNTSKLVNDFFVIPSSSVSTSTTTATSSGVVVKEPAASRLTRGSKKVYNKYIRRNSDTMLSHNSIAGGMTSFKPRISIKLKSFKKNRTNPNEQKTAENAAAPAPAVASSPNQLSPSNCAELSSPSLNTASQPHTSSSPSPNSPSTQASSSKFSLFNRASNDNLNSPASASKRAAFGANVSPISSPTAGASTSYYPPSSPNAVMQCLQNLNYRFLGKRHSVSILKYNSSNLSSPTNPVSSSAAIGAGGGSTSPSKVLSPTSININNFALNSPTSSNTSPNKNSTYYSWFYQNNQNSVSSNNMLSSPSSSKPVAGEKTSSTMNLAINAVSPLMNIASAKLAVHVTNSLDSYQANNNHNSNGLSKKLSLSNSRLENSSDQSSLLLSPTTKQPTSPTNPNNHFIKGGTFLLPSSAYQQPQGKGPSNDNSSSLKQRSIKVKSNAPSRHSSFKLKRKTKRSKSTPSNVRNSSSAHHFSLSGGGSSGASKENSNSTSTATAAHCIYCDQKLTRANQAAILQPFFNQNATISLQDQLIRRTFSRRNYGSFELLFTLDREGIIQNIGKFRIENGESHEGLNTSNTIHLENPESQTRWYFKYFLGRLHQNYLIEDKNKIIYFLSVVITDANDRHIPQYKVILWTKQGSQKLTLSYQHSKQITVKQILNHFQIETDKSPKEIIDPEIQRELLLLEEQEGSINFKFGIVYAKHGQLTDDEMLSNEHGSPEFEQFINLIGDKIRLKGWKRYRGGLDNSSDTTGEHSVYTIYEGHEIMFHVSTLLPYVKDSKQQLERKRHIGNDIVTIVFQDLEDNDEPDFTPSSARSQFQHIFALVVHNKKDNSYRLRIYSEQSVPPFGPSLPTPPLFTNHKEFREFLLVKLINGEKSAFNNTVFGKRRKRTIDAIITSLHQTYDKENFKVNSNIISSGGIGEVISDALISGNIRIRRKEEMRKAEFLRIGQNLKLQTILKGDAPTSQITTGAVKKELWEPQIFLQSFNNSIICSDSWNNLVVLGTNNGVVVIDEAIPWETKELFDKSVQPRQLDVCELFGLLILLIDKGRICIFRLSEFNQLMSDSNSDQNQTKTKAHCKDRKIEFISGCHLYALSKQMLNHKNENTLRIAAACGKKLILAQLKNVCNTCTSSMNSASATSASSSSTTATASALVTNPLIGISNLTIGQASITSSLSSHNLGGGGGGNTTTSTTSSTTNGSSGNDTTLNDVASMFYVRKEITCSDVPQLINIVDSNSGDNYLLVGYKSKCELLSERTGECLRQFQFNQLSTIRSIVELYDQDRLEILVTYNYTSEFIKLDGGSSTPSNSNMNANPQLGTMSPPSTKRAEYAFQWNCEPHFVLCIFPYVIGFASQCIEIRLLVNGNLVNSITMSNIKIVASKREIFFSADHELFISKEYVLNDRYMNSYVINVTNPNNTSTSHYSTNSPATGNNNGSNNANDNEFSPPSSPNQEKESSNYSNNNSNTFSFNSSSISNQPKSSREVSNTANSSISTATTGGGSVSATSSSAASSSNSSNNKQPCTIYKINLDFLKNTNAKSSEKFVFNQLCENSTRTIQREISNFSSQFIFTEADEATKHNSIYRRIIASNKKEGNGESSDAANSAQSPATVVVETTGPSPPS